MSRTWRKNVENGGTNPTATKDVNKTMRSRTVVAGREVRRRHHRGSLLALGDQQLPDLISRLFILQTRLRQHAIRSPVTTASSSSRHLDGRGGCLAVERKEEKRSDRLKEF